MSVFRNIFFLAVAAGLIAGIAMTVLQARFTVPLILAAETYENAAPAAHDARRRHPGRTPTSPRPGPPPTASSAWPSPSPPTSSPPSASRSSSSPPPTSPAASPAGAAASSGASPASPSSPSPRASACRPSSRRCPPPSSSPARSGGSAPSSPPPPASRWSSSESPRPSPPLGVALVVLPHLVGAPQPASFETPVPEGLHHRFVVAVTVTNLVFWALLGALAGALKPRVEAWLASPKDRLA